MPSSEVLSCPICYCEYDNNETIPRVIPHCGHTICTPCLKIIIQKPSTAKCPLDNKPFNFEFLNISMFPINFIVKQLFNDKPCKQNCSNHSQKLRLVCLTDGCYVCDECVFQGEHKGHEIKPRKKYDEEAQSRKKELESVLKGVNHYHEDIELMFEEKRQSLLGFIQNSFQELRWTLIKKELELCLEVNSLFEVEKNGKACELELNSEYISSIMRTTTELKEAIQSGNSFKIMSFDAEKLKSSIDGDSFQEHFQELYRKLNNLTVNFHESLNNQLQSLAAIKSPLDDIMGTISLEHVLEYKPAEVLKSGNLMAASLVNKDLNIEVQDGVLVISVGANLAKKQDIRYFVTGLESWNKLEKVQIKLLKSDSLFEGIQALAYLWTNLNDNITSIKIDCMAKNVTDKDLINLFAIVFNNTAQLTDFYLDLCDAKVGDLCLKPLCEEILPKAIRLKSLTLNLNNTLVTDNSIKALGTNQSIRRLETFDLRLWETKITDRGVTGLFTKMEKVKKFVLDLGLTGVTNESIKTFANVTVPSMKVVEEFKLGLAQTHVDDYSVSQVFIPMPSVKSFYLYLHGTRITDISIEALARKTVTSFDSLEVFEVRAGDTKISDYAVAQLFGLGNLENVKRFVLKVQGTGITDKAVDSFIKAGFPTMSVLNEFEFDVTRTQVSDKMTSQLARLRDRLGFGMGV